MMRHIPLSDDEVGLAALGGELTCEVRAKARTPGGTLKGSRRCLPARPVAIAGEAEPRLDHLAVAPRRVINPCRRVSKEVAGVTYSFSCTWKRLSQT